MRLYPGGKSEDIPSLPTCLHGVQMANFALYHVDTEQRAPDVERAIKRPGGLRMAPIWTMIPTTSPSTIDVPATEQTPVELLTLQDSGKTCQMFYY
jgi:hypothetical protein